MLITDQMNLHCAPPTESKAVLGCFQMRSLQQHFDPDLPTSTRTHLTSGPAGLVLVFYVQTPFPACSELLRCMPFQPYLFHIVIGFVAFDCSLTVNGSPCPKTTSSLRRFQKKVNLRNVVKRSSCLHNPSGRRTRRRRQLLSEQTVALRWTRLRRFPRAGVRR